MKRTRTILAAVILLAFAALPAFAKNGGSNGGCVSVIATSAQLNGGAPAESFSATRILDIDLWVLFNPGSANRFSGDHQVELKIFTPHGFLYQSTAIPFTYDAKGKGTQRKLDGYPLPLDVRVLQPVSWAKGKELGTSVRLPVAGTLIMSNSLYGTWSAEAYVDGDSLKCAEPASFEIRP
ncbi:MAG: hypothetical protein WBX15_18705 [Thermoanaerobaculia bacterium]